ncbi:MAG: hypothetical protein N3D84_01385 [Candidatus Woesearchaeota archaeon]|nr:hypothetical protein [Candidatus Woesearchaeota archaeon]
MVSNAKDIIHLLVYSRLPTEGSGYSFDADKITKEATKKTESKDIRVLCVGIDNGALDEEGKIEYRIDDLTVKDEKIIMRGVMDSINSKKLEDYIDAHLRKTGTKVIAVERPAENLEISIPFEQNTYGIVKDYLNSNNIGFKESNLTC